MPIIGKETQIRAFEVESLEGNFIKYDLSRLLRGKGLELQLKVKVVDKKAVGIPRKLALMPYFLKRMVRKGTNYVEDSFSTECTNAQLRIKPFLVTRKKVSRAVRKTLREQIKKDLIEYVKNKETGEIFDDIIKNKLQKQLSLRLKKIYPLSLCEIRVLKVEKELENTKKEKTEVTEKVDKKEEVKTLQEE